MISYAQHSRRTKAAALAVVLIAFTARLSAQDAKVADQSAAAKQGPVTLTLKDALALAEKNDPAVLAAASDVLSAREDNRQARAALYPSVSARSEYLGTQGNGKLPSGRFVTNDGVHVYREWGVVHQDLSPGLLSRTAVQRTQVIEAQTRAKGEIARRGLAATVTRNYYALVVAQRKYATAQASLTNAQRSRNISEELERGREVAHSDVVRSQLLELAQEQGVEDARLAVENARLDLAVLLYRDFNQDFSIVDDLDSPSPLPAYDEVETMAARGNPTVASAIEAVRAARLDVKIARQAFLPTLTVDAVYGLEANELALNGVVAAATPLGPLPSLGYFVTASLNFPVWDWGIRHSKVKQSEFRREQASVDLSLAQRTMLRNLRGFYDEAQVSRRQIDLLRRAGDLAAENLRLVLLRYQAGEATLIELVDAQTSLTQARNAYDDGMARYRLAISNLQTVTGTF
jgi:outer membrane protein TolC